MIDQYDKYKNTAPSDQYAKNKQKMPQPTFEQMRHAAQELRELAKPPEQAPSKWVEQAARTGALSKIIDAAKQELDGKSLDGE